MPSSENSSPTTDILKRLVAQQESARHQHHESMADKLTSCLTTPIYNKVAHDLAPDQHLSNNKVAVTADQPAPSKAAATPNQGKAAVTTDQPTSSKAATVPSQSKVAVTADQSASSKRVSSTPQAASSQQPITNSQQPERHIWWMSAWSWLRTLFDFREDKAGDVATIESFREDVEFRGTKLWVLIYVILVASIGLNVNSAAVIIGAMLIFPLMGPVISFGLGFGTADLDLMRKSLRDLALTTLFSTTTVTVYFLLTPLDQPGNELLGRMEPPIYDVLIVFSGGAAGLIANSSKSKGQVLPGVAIATALMPPLRTAGFGIAMGNWAFFSGAICLHIINLVSIAFAIFMMVRIMRFPMKMVASGDIRKRSYRWITVIAACTLIPSIYLSVRLVRDSYQEQRVKQFVVDHFVSSDHQMIRQSLVYDEGEKAPYIDVVLIGKPLSAQAIDSVATLLPSYGLSSLELQVRQGFDNEAPTDYEQLGGVLLRDLYERSERTASEQRAEIDSPRHTFLRYDYYKSLTHDMSDETRAVFTDISQVRLVPSMEFIQGQDSALHILVTTLSHRISPAERNKLEKWLQKRIKVDALQLILTN